MTEPKSQAVDVTNIDPVRWAGWLVLAREWRTIPWVRRRALDDVIALIRVGERAKALELAAAASLDLMELGLDAR